MVPAKPKQLTARHREAINLIDQGDSRQQIAAHWGVSASRVSQIVGEAKIYLGASSDAELVRLYMEREADKPFDPREEALEFAIANDDYEPIEVPIELPGDDLRGISVVPESLNGTNAVRNRILAIVAIAVGIVGIFVLTVVLMLIIGGQSRMGAKLVPFEEPTETPR